jgi:hypothetical protein
MFIAVIKKLLSDTFTELSDGFYNVYKFDLP